MHGVTDLRFDHEDDGIVAQAGVGPEKHEEIGEATDGYTEIGVHSFLPGAVNFSAAFSHHAAPYERFRGPEAGAMNQSVDRALHSIVRDDAAFADLGDGLGDEFDIGAFERWIEIIRNENALAAQLIVGCQRGAQLGVLILRARWRRAMSRLSCGKSDCQENRGRELPGAREYIAGRPSA